MRLLNFHFLFFSVILLFSSHNIYPQEYEIIAYLHGGGSKSNLKSLYEKGLFNKITVVNYAFAIPEKDSSGNIIPVLHNAIPAYVENYGSEESIDFIADDSTNHLKGQFNQIKKIKLQNPNLKIVISIGGWGGSKYFSDLAQTHESREKFVDTCISMFIYGNLPQNKNAGGRNSAFGVFDGIDLDWEFPISGGPEGTHNNPNDRENHTALFKLFREKLDAINPELLLTAAVSGRSDEFWKYNFSEDQKYLDWMNLMNYDLHGVWDKYTGHHTNLLSNKNDKDPKKESINRMVRYLIDTAKVSPQKIAIGAAYYGKGWTNVDTENNGLFQKGEFLNSWGYIKFNNYLDYKELNNNGFEYFWDIDALAPYLYNKNEKIFWSYDDVKSIALKSWYVDSYNLKGLMFWQILGDDSLGTLTNTIYNKNMPEVTIHDSKKNGDFPKVTLNFHNESESIFEGGIIQLFADVDYNNDSILKAEFFVDDISIGYCTYQPFDWAWFNVKAGNHKIKCIVNFNNGSSAISNIINISVENRKE